MEAMRARVEDHGRRLDALEASQPAVIAAQVQNLAKDVEDLRDEMRALKRALYGLAISIAGGSVLFAFTAFQLWGGGP
jgi:hypothetical protein